MTPITELIAELSQLEAKATPGPWTHEGFNLWTNGGCPPYEAAIEERDAAFIVAVRSALPAILDRLRHLEIMEEFREKRRKDDDVTPKPHERCETEAQYRDNLRHHMAQWMHNGMGLGGAWAATSEWIFARNVFRAIKRGELDRYMTSDGK